MTITFISKKLTQTEKYCIQGMFYNEMELSSIAKSLGRDEDLVREYVEQLEKETKGFAAQLFNKMKQFFGILGK